MIKPNIIYDNYFYFRVLIYVKGCKNMDTVKFPPQLSNINKNIIPPSNNSISTINDNNDTF